MSSSDPAHKLALTLLVNLVVDTQSYRYAPIIARGRKFAIAQNLTRVYADRFWSSGQAAEFVTVDIHAETRRVQVAFKGLPTNHPATQQLVDALGRLDPPYTHVSEPSGVTSINPPA